MVSGALAKGATQNKNVYNLICKTKLKYLYLYKLIHMKQSKISYILHSTGNLKVVPLDEYDTKRWNKNLPLIYTITDKFLIWGYATQITRH